MKENDELVQRPETNWDVGNLHWGVRIANRQTNGPRDELRNEQLKKH